MKTNQQATINRFNTNHVRSAAAKIAGRPLTTWNDGPMIIIAAGEGEAGNSLAAKVVAACSMPMEIMHSEILGSVADLQAKAAAGITKQTFVLVRPPPATVDTTSFRIGAWEITPYEGTGRGPSFHTITFFIVVGPHVKTETRVDMDGLRDILPPRIHSELMTAMALGKNSIHSTTP